MKIVHALGWYFPDSLGGTEVYVAALAERLRAKGHEVLVAAPDAGSTAARTYGFQESVVFRYPVPARPTRAESQGDVKVRGVEHLHQWLRQVRPDVFHCHSLVTGLGLFEIEAARAAGARVLVTFHTPGLGYLCQRGSMMRWGTELCDGIARPAKCASCELQHRGLPRALAKLAGAAPVALARRASSLPGPVGTGLGMPALIERNVARELRLIENVDAVFVLTEWARRAVEANVGPTKKLHLNRLGVASGRFDRERKREVSRFLRLGYLGRFDPIKGVSVLARAIARLPRDLEFTLELRGSGGSEAEGRLRVLAKDDPRLRFERAVPPEAVPEVLATYDLLLCPAIALEGGPTVALEAHAMGTPVLGSRIGGLAEIIEDGVNGRLTPPGDAESLASAIEEVVRSPGGTIDRWREKLASPRTMDDISRDYLRLYRAPGDGERA